jgi:hypothetical protein
MVVYSAVHNWRLLTAGISGEMVIWAALGVVGLELTAIFLPIALHWWTHAPLQRLIAFGFYFADLALIFLNVVLDYAVVSGASEIPGWLRLYLFFGVPATPVFAGLGWSILFLLDPSSRERGMIENLRASTREALAARIAQQAKSADIAQAVDLAAANMASDIVGATLGGYASKAAPRGVIEGQARDVEPKPRRRRSIFQNVYRRRNGRQAYALETDTPETDRPNVDLEKVQK